MALCSTDFSLPLISLDLLGGEFFAFLLVHFFSQHLQWVCNMRGEHPGILTTAEAGKPITLQNYAGASPPAFSPPPLLFLTAALSRPSA